MCIDIIHMLTTEKSRVHLSVNHLCVVVVGRWRKINKQEILSLCDCVYAW